MTTYYQVFNHLNGEHLRVNTLEEALVIRQNIIDQTLGHFKDSFTISKEEVIDQNTGTSTWSGVDLTNYPITLSK
jgi:alanine racemase